jgi:chromatin assembly factor 1 subunit A
VFLFSAIPALIKLIHGNVNRREFLIKEFLAYWNKQQQQRSIEEEMGERSVEGNVSALPSFDIFKKSVSNKIKELASWVACPDGGPMSGRMCWYVSPETRAAHGLADITIPNSLWNYTFKPKRRESDIQVPSSSPVLNSESNPKQLITKFTKKMTEVERKRQFNTALTLGEMPNKRQGDGSYQHNDKIQKKSVIISSCKEMPSFKTGEEHKKKVPILMSVPNEQELHKSYKNSLMKFMKPQGSVPGEGDKIVHSFLSSDRTVVPKTQDTGGEDCIVLSD